MSDDADDPHTGRRIREADLARVIQALAAEGHEVVRVEIVGGCSVTFTTPEGHAADEGAAFAQWRAANDPN